MGEITMRTLVRRNPVAKAVRSPKFRPQVVPDKRRQLKLKATRKELRQ